MIKIYDANEKLFNTNGLKILHPLSAIVFKEDNGDYYVEIEDSIDDIDYYQANMIVSCPTPFPEGQQAFRITSTEKNNTRIKIKAKHVYFDSENYIIDDKFIVDKDCNYALNYLNNNCDNVTPFTTLSNVVGNNTYRCVRKSLSEAISVLIERWGGHLIRNNFNITINQNIGSDRGIVIKYKKNIKNIKAEENWQDVITKIMPVGKDGLLLPEKYLSITEKIYDIPFSKVVSFNQDLEKEENETDEEFNERLLLDLKNKATAYLEENKYPKVNYNLSANIDNITDVGDIIYVEHPKLNIKMTTNVISIKWDAISKKYKNIEFGNFKNKLKDLFKQINSISSELSKNSSETTKSFLEKELIQATSKIWNTLGNSFVIYDGDKILIVDSLPKENAKNVLLINNGGIGFSKTGINGTFSTAWTIDGGFCADFITTGKIKTTLIEGYNDLVLSVNEIKDLTKTISGDGYIDLTNAMEGRVNYFSVKGEMSLLFPSSKTYPGKTTFTKNANLVLEDNNGNKKIFHTNIKTLNHLNDIYDEFIITDTETYLIRRIGMNSDSSLYVLENEIKEQLDVINLELFEGYNKLYFSSFNDLNYTIKYTQKNKYTDTFATKVEMNSELELQDQRLNLNLSKKVGNDEIIARINMSTEKNEDGSYIGIEADKLNFKGKEINLTGDNIVIKSTNFNVDKDGKITATAGDIGGFKIDEYKLFGKNIKGECPFTSEDKNKVKNYITNNYTGLTDEEIELYDINHDGKVNSVDYMMMHNLIRDSEKQYTVELNTQYLDRFFNFQDEDGSYLARIGHLGSYFSDLTVTKDFKYLPEGTTDRFSILTSNTESSSTLHINLDDSKSVSQIQIDKTSENSGAVVSVATLDKNGNFTCNSLTQTSLEENKKNFEKIENALEEIKKTDIYSYNLKSEDDNHKKHLGFVIGNNYNYSHLITAIDENEKEIGVDNYSMTSLCLQAIKEQQEIIEKLEKRIDELEEKINGNNN